MARPSWRHREFQLPRHVIAECQIRRARQSSGGHLIALFKLEMDVKVFPRIGAQVVSLDFECSHFDAFE